MSNTHKQLLERIVTAEGVWVHGRVYWSPSISKLHGGRVQIKIDDNTLDYVLVLQGERILKVQLSSTVQRRHDTSQLRVLASEPDCPK